MPIWPKQLVLAQPKALVLAGQQLVGLPLRDEAFLDHQLGQAILVFERGLAVVARCLVQKQRQLGLVHEAATPDQVQQLVGGYLGHGVRKSALEMRVHSGITAAVARFCSASRKFHRTATRESRPLISVPPGSFLPNSLTHERGPTDAFLKTP